jgi:peptidoglycan/xylan/chitin deacetylase (PgdA/CDA1 family)
VGTVLLTAALLPARFATAQTTDDSLLKNGGFEDGTANWSLNEKVPMSQIIETGAHTGQKALHIADTDKNGSNVLSARLTVAPGQAYRLTFWSKASAGGASGVYLWFYRTDGLIPDYQPCAIVKQSTDWTANTLLAKVPEGATALAVWIHSFSTPTVTLDLDDIRLTPATAVETAALPMPTLAREGTPQPRKSPPYVILKLDDLVNTRGRVPERFKKLGDYIRTKQIKASIGIICNSLEGDNPEYTQWIKDLRDTGLVEFWSHGYTHKEWDENGKHLQEFNGTPYEEQKQHFDRCEDLAKEKLGFAFTAFGAPFNGTDANTARALREESDIKTWLYGDLQDPAGKIVLDRIGAVNIENPLFVPSLERFIAGYNKYPTREYFVIQGHPNQWDDTRFDQFTKIVDFLIEQKAKLVTPTEYAAILGKKVGGAGE